MASQAKKQKGKIIKKTVQPWEFDVLYQCPCGEYVQFDAEVQRQCRGCQIIYQLRVMIGKAH